ncbi:hypothetical protein [Izhakiella australiensis]|uniref:hypothetical protein n=1 Tax=Izhakiella australiensis TaxID=1926881 RepID=UPI00098FC76B|nr:hypothetical protein [Izhakiella australiensis]
MACADVFITLLIDFNRTAYAVSRGDAQQIVEQAAEGIIVGSFDAGIMLNALQTATISLGYGTTAIGGIRYYPEKMVRLLELPAKTYPIAGMTIGVIDRDHLPKTKPRVPVESFAMRERYDSQKVKDGVDTYDRQLRAWWDNQGLEKMKSYSASLAETYTTNRYYKIASTLADQGFIFK